MVRTSCCDILLAAHHFLWCVCVVPNYQPVRWVVWLCHKFLQFTLFFSVAPWRPVCHMIFQYVSQIASSSHTQPLIQSQVENLLSKTYQKWKNRTSGNSEGGPSVDEIPWDDILAVCIDHKLRDWKPPKLPIAPGIVSFYNMDDTSCITVFNNLTVVPLCVAATGM